MILPHSTLFHSTWLESHGRLWYDDRWYRLAWLLWPQALLAALVLLLWVMPPGTKNAPWGKPVDHSARMTELMNLRDKAKSDQSAMEQLQQIARGGEADAQFYYATLFDPQFKNSTIVQPDIGNAVEWYWKAANEGQEIARSNLAVLYSSGQFLRIDYTRACYYARLLKPNSLPPGLEVKGECYARGLGATPVDMNEAAQAFDAAANGGNFRAIATLGYFFENGLGGKPRSNETAVKYYRIAADNGDALGMHNLGFAYNGGLLGLQRDGNEAARLIALALDRKYFVTCQSLTSHPEYWTSDFWVGLQRRLTERRFYSGSIDGRSSSGILETVRRMCQS